MDKLRKFGQALWRYKERIILAAMFLVLCWQVYALVTFEEETEIDPPIPVAGEMDVPNPQMSIPLRPEPPRGTSLSRLRSENPYSYENTSEAEEEEAEFELTVVRDTPSGARATIRFENRPRLVQLDDTLGDYRVAGIDIENESVTLVQEGAGGSITLRVD